NEGGGSNQPMHAGAVVEAVGSPQRRIEIALGVAFGAVALALAVRLMAGGAIGSVNIGAALRIGGALKQWGLWRPPALQRLVDRDARAQELDIGNHRLHLFAAEREHASIHAALHAAFDALFQSAHLVFAGDVQRE